MTTRERNLCRKAVFEFLAWASTRPGTLKVGAGHDAAPLVAAIDEWGRMVGVLKSANGTKPGFAGARGGGGKQK